MSLFNVKCLNWDLSVYLVTNRDERFALNKEGITAFLDHIQACLEGGVRVIQLREKQLDNENFIKLAESVLKITRRYGAKLVINDNIEVAIQVGADGLHIGQDDVSLKEALAKCENKLAIGVSVDSVAQALEAIEGGASYLGIGPIFPTQTKQLTKPVMGFDNVKAILDAIEPAFPVVGISGIHLSNIDKVMNECYTSKLSPTSKSLLRRLNGVAVVSALMNAKQPCEVAQMLRKAVKSYPNPAAGLVSKEIEQNISYVLNQLVEVVPIVHHLTNLVAINDNANITLAVGASPIMAPELAEAEAITQISNALLLNIGTLNLKSIETMIEAGKLANKKSKPSPILLDPVGIGASQLRKDAALDILKSCNISIIKGNASEILTLAKTVSTTNLNYHVEITSNNASRGVDASDVLESPLEIAAFVAKHYKCVVVMTGEIDYITDGSVGYSVHNGHFLLSKITGSGCMLGSVISALSAVTTPLLAGLIGTVLFNICAEKVAESIDGPSMLRSKLFDELYKTVRSEPKQRQSFELIKVVEYPNLSNHLL